MKRAMMLMPGLNMNDLWEHDSQFKRTTNIGWMQNFSNPIYGPYNIDYKNIP